MHLVGLLIYKLQYDARCIQCQKVISTYLIDLMTWLDVNALEQAPNIFLFVAIKSVFELKCWCSGLPYR